MNSKWQTSACICAETDGESVLAIPHPDAPSGVSNVIQCRGCGLRRLSPRPGPEIIGGYYGQAYNAFIGRKRGRLKQAIWDFLRDVSSSAPGRGRRLAILRPLVRPIAWRQFDINIPLGGPAGRRVLEVGCGFGDLLIYLQSRGCSVQGVDLDERAAEQGRKYGVPIEAGQLKDFEFPAASFDVGIMCHSLEHVPVPAVEIAELARVLRPGAELHIAVPNGTAAGLNVEGVDWCHLSHPLHFWYFDATNLPGLLADHGFDVVDCRYTTHWKFHLEQCLKAVRKSGLRRGLGFSRRLLRGLLAGPDRGDILRVVAVRRGK